MIPMRMPALRSAPKKGATSSKGTSSRNFVSWYAATPAATISAGLTRAMQGGRRRISSLSKWCS